MNSALATQSALRFPTFPARPVNGGPLDKAQPKFGSWYYEPKFNGWRALVHAPTGTMFNRKGERLSIASEFSTALALLKKTSLEWLDCEALERRHNIGRGSLVLFDHVVPNDSYATRRGLLELACAFADIPKYLTLNKPIPDNTVVLTPAYKAAGALAPVAKLCPESVGTEYGNMLGLWDILKACNQALGCEFYEGLVAKRADSTYPIQLRSPDQEFPFWHKHRWQF